MTAPATTDMLATELAKGYHVNNVTGCHLWDAEFSSRAKLPILNLLGNVVHVAFLRWKLTGNEVPDGKLLRMACENDRCVNVEHMELIDQPAGSDQGPSPEEVAAILMHDAEGRKQAWIAEKLGISQSKVSRTLKAHRQATNES
jgi:predicted DNA-binding protein (UPF0251 family)